ncbi:hypothetical protein [Amycolatopsis sp. YIM 10]|uniref:hypothetical protein n=1 Tax=Amycolatopsis sp. YIM 10 TaxID=2653857 RepID=UPI0012902B4E|nr:hypothetical protein [Amycolatopsis sp. YIM 10]QFU89927.1 hypothetical protein YIM_23750 [Amycolatopsis sp. YIM 10]
MEFLPAVAAFLSLPLFLGAFAWYAVRARRRGGGQSLMGPFEEIWDPIAHKTNIEIRIEAERSPETPSPGDPPELSGLRRYRPAEPGRRADE